MMFKTFIVAGLLLMLSGAAIALPSTDIKTIIIGAAFCWLSLPCFWLAARVQYPR